MVGAVDMATISRIAQLELMSHDSLFSAQCNAPVVDRKRIE
jgi:hypothetical protein